MNGAPAEASLAALAPEVGDATAEVVDATKEENMEVCIHISVCHLLSKPSRTIVELELRIILDSEELISLAVMVILLLGNIVDTTGLKVVIATIFRLDSYYNDTTG
jgi:hypothetical protein